MLPTDLLTSAATYFPLLSTLTSGMVSSAGLSSLLGGGSSDPSKPSSNETGNIEMPSEEQLAALPESERLMEAANAAQAAAQAQGMADSLRTKAALITDPKERERMLTQAYEREVEANGNSRKARMFKSGAFQGAAGGAGIGGAVGLGLGTVIGTVVGGVTSIPTTLLGGLVGSGVGLVHGPFIKLAGSGKEVQISQKDVDSGAVSIDEKTGQVTAKDPAKLEKLARERADEVKRDEEAGGEAPKPERRKPKKLEVRSGKKKPAKLEVRSGKPAQTA